MLDCISHSSSLAIRHACKRQNGMTTVYNAWKVVMPAFAAGFGRGKSICQLEIYDSRDNKFTCVMCGSLPVTSWQQKWIINLDARHERQSNVWVCELISRPHDAL